MTDFKFDVACYLNLTADHMERYKDINDYAAAKKRIFNNQDENCRAIICRDQEITEKIFLDLKNNIKYELIGFKSSDIFNDEKLPNLPGKHNLQNIGAAYFIADYFKLKKEKIISSVKNFRGLEHRTEKIYEDDNLLVINDSKATNADATKPAFEAFENIFWLAGGVPKDEGIEPLKNYFKNINKAYFFGQSADDFGKIFMQENLNCEIFSNLDDAVKKLLDDLKNTEKNEKKKKNKKTILFSPSCASFDQFNNFEERGNYFKKLIKEKILEI